MTWMRLALPMSIAACLAGCAAPASDFCATASPIYLETLDGKTETEKRQILAHNEYGEQHCGWRAAE